MAENAWLNPLSYMWKITDVRWKSTPPGTGAAVLRITYGTDPAWPNSRAKKAYSVSKDINLTLRFSQNSNPALRLFQECISPKESSINNLQNDICGSMTQVTSTGNIMVWSDATQGCVALGNTSTPVKKCAAANMVIDGINADGTVRCKMLTNGVVPATDLMDNSGCAPGSSIRMEFDVVTRKVKAVCY